MLNWLHTVSLIFENFYLLILERERRRERKALSCCSTYEIYSLVDSSVYSDQGLNPQPWFLRTMFQPTEPPGQGAALTSYSYNASSYLCSNFPARLPCYLHRETNTREQDHSRYPSTWQPQLFPVLIFRKSYPRPIIWGLSILPRTQSTSQIYLSHQFISKVSLRVETQLFFFSSQINTKKWNVRLILNLFSWVLAWFLLQACFISLKHEYTCPFLPIFRLSLGTKSLLFKSSAVAKKLAVIKN